MEDIIQHLFYNDFLFESNKYDNEIKKDLARTFPDNILFKYGNIYYNKLYHILTAYANLNKKLVIIKELIILQLIYYI